MAQLSRRGFIGASLLTGGGLLLNMSIPLAAKAADGKPVSLTAFIRVLPDNSFVIGAKNAEMGQGAKTALPMMIAEEFDVSWSQVTVEQTHSDPSLFGPQNAGGSRTTGREWIPSRQAGAAARAVMVSAAASLWSVPAGEITTANGVVTHAKTGKTARYADLAEQAARLPAPDLATLTLKDPANYTIIGKPVKNVDAPAIVAGKPLFGIDVDLPGMLYAVFVSAPAMGGPLKSADFTAVKARAGIHDAFEIKGKGNIEWLMDGVAIVADSWWSANQARSSLKVEWDTSAQEQFSTASYAAQAEAKHAGKADADIVRHGDFDAAFAAAPRKVKARYSYPFIAHGTLEPQNCTALYKDGKLELWVPTQNPESGRDAVSKTLGIAPGDMRINLTRTGGGFGRRLMVDYMVQAAAIAMKVPGRPVKMIYTRQDDFQRDFFRPAGWHDFAAGVDGAGKLVAFKDHFVTFGAGGRPNRSADLPATSFPAGLVDNLIFEHSLLETNLLSGWLRAPGSNALSYAFQGFLDEVAEVGGIDLPTLMLNTLGAPRDLETPRPPAFNTGRATGVIKKVVEMANWANRGSLPQGHGKGFAFYFSHMGYFAEVVEVKVENDIPTVLHVWAAGDVGSQIVNPLNAEQQVFGSIIEGLGQAMAGQDLTQVGGVIEQTNYDGHPFQRIAATPKIDLEYIVTDNVPTGLGEPALPPVIPAMVNAIYAACGKRVRSLPVDLAKIA